MKKRIALIALGMAGVMMLGGCASVKDMVTDKLEEIAGQSDTSETGTDKDDINPEVEAPKSDGAESLALLGDLMGEKYGDADVTPEVSDTTDSDDEEYEGDVNAPENQTVVTEAAMWQGYYEGVVTCTGFGEEYDGINAEYIAYAIVRDPEDDFPFLEIYSDDFDIWDNVSFAYEDQALVSMYVDLTDDEMLPVVYKFGDAYVVDVSLTDSEAQVFKCTSDGRHDAKIEATYDYYDPELDSEGGMVLEFDLRKMTIY
ncbi:MAG: hypothetical protein J5509_03640 [Lachnospiraceae bacterium]|nr:hypothetical protein [Lachnospiraceae bacterium]